MSTAANPTSIPTPIRPPPRLPTRHPQLPPSFEVVALMWSPYMSVMSDGLSVGPAPTGPAVPPPELEPTAADPFDPASPAAPPTPLVRPSRMQFRSRQKDCRRHRPYPETRLSRPAASPLRCKGCGRSRNPGGSQSVDGSLVNPAGRSVDDGGCSCRSGTRSRPSSGALSALALSSLLSIARRRSRLLHPAD